MRIGLPKRHLIFFSNRKWSIVAFLAVSLLYLVAFMTLPKSVFWSPDEGVKFVQLHVSCGAENSHHPIPYRGQQLDPTYDFSQKLHMPLIIRNR
jgi:hypothetical protein